METPYQSLPNTPSLIAFAQTARERNLERAAVVLQRSPAELARDIGALEAQLGCALFQRRDAGLELTPEGTKYLGVVLAALDQLRDVQRELAARSGPLRLSTLAAFHEQWLIPHLPEFVRAHPEIELDIEATLRYDDFDRDPVDAAIRFGSGEWGELYAEPLFETVAIAVCSPALLAGRHPLRSVGDLTEHTLIHIAQVPEAWSEWLATAGVPDLRPRRHLRFDNVAVALNAAESGLGVALCAQFLCEQKLQERRLVRPFEQALAMRSTYHFVCRRQSLADERIIALRDWLMTSLQSR